jgi:hypothetical protein
MGYRLFYDPTIQWLFFVSILGVLGLSQYFWKKVNLVPWMNEVPDSLAPEPVSAESAAEPDSDQSMKLNESNMRQTTTENKIPTTLLTGDKH